MVKLNGELSDKIYIVAIDFDGTICRGGFPDISKGELIQSTMQMISRLKKEAGQPVSFILWTCRAGRKLEEAVEFCKKYNVPIDYVNEQHPSVYEWLEDAKDLRKIFAHEYWDDRAVRVFDHMNVTNDRIHYTHDQSTYIDQFYFTLESKLNEYFQLLDRGIWEIGKDTILKIFPDDILYFSNSAYISWKVSISIENIFNKRFLIDRVNKVLNIIGHEPVKDEDLKNGIDGRFSFNTENTLYTVNCWIIPGLHDGIWENHVLSNK